VHRLDHPSKSPEFVKVLANEEQTWFLQQIPLAHKSNGATDTQHVLVLDHIVFIFEPDTSISISLVGEKIHCLGFGFTNEKNVFVFSSIQSNILYIKDIFGGISHLRQYRILVSLSKDNMCVLSQESETTLKQYFWVFKF
jgi:hypothetical protein